jgi:mannose-6-phosphate isomerase-like protein (cupin superfamily)
MRDPVNTDYISPKGGPAVRMPEGVLITRKVSSEQTGGAYSLFEAAVGPQVGSQPHIQHREDECFYVLEGQFEFVIEGSKVEASIGSLIYVSKGALHAFKNLSQSTGRLLVSQTPGGVYEGFVEEVGMPATEKDRSPTAEEPPEADRLTEIGTKYGLEMVLPVP